MSDYSDKLIRMAEQISANLAIDGDDERAGAKLADHMQRFWDPRMRRAFLQRAQQDPGALDARLSAASRLLREATKAEAS